MLTRIKLKNASVDISSPAPAGLLILLALNTVGEKYNINFVVTVGWNGKHAENSKHYTREALDVRSHDFDDGMQEIILHEMRDILGVSYFTGILEDYDTPNEHFHWQRRKNTTDLDMIYVLSRFSLKAVEQPYLKSQKLALV